MIIHRSRRALEQNRCHVCLSCLGLLYARHRGQIRNLNLNPAIASALRTAFGEGEKSKEGEPDNVVPKPSQPDKKKKHLKSQTSGDPTTATTPSTSLSNQAPETIRTILLRDLEERQRRYQDSIGKAQDDVTRAADGAVKEPTNDVVQEEKATAKRTNQVYPSRGQPITQPDSTSQMSNVEAASEKLKTPAEGTDSAEGSKDISAERVMARSSARLRNIRRRKRTQLRKQDNSKEEKTLPQQAEHPTVRRVHSHFTLRKVSVGEPRADLTTEEPSAHRVQDAKDTNSSFLSGSHERVSVINEQLRILNLPEDLQKVIIKSILDHPENTSIASQEIVPPPSTLVSRVRSRSLERSTKDAPLSQSGFPDNETVKGKSLKDALLSPIPRRVSGADTHQKAGTLPFVAKGLLNSKKPERKIASMKGLKSPITQINAKHLEVEPLYVGQPSVPSLFYGLDRVLFNPGIYQLQDPRSRVYNFDPYLQTIMPASEFDYSALGQFITSSQDDRLQDLAKSHNKRYIGSTSSMSSVLSHFHFLLSQWRGINAGTLSKAFPATLTSFTLISRAPQAIFLKWQDGTYAIDADKEFASTNVLSLLGRSMEKLFTLDTEDFERYRKSNEYPAIKTPPESYHYTTFGDFLMRSQLDAHDSRLPGTGMFDLKTRAVVSIRMDNQSPENGSGYEIKSRFGEWESYEREYYDMIRATMLKYSLQVRMGRMDGIFVAYHNTERIFGFQYVSLPELDFALHGQEETVLGDQEFKISLDLLNKVLNRATEKYPGQSLRLHFETREAQTPFMYAFAEPVTEEQLRDIQGKNNAKMAETERNILGLDSDSEDLDDEKAAHQWSEIQASVKETMDNDERSLSGNEAHDSTSSDQSTLEQANYEEQDKVEQSESPVGNGSLNETTPTSTSNVVEGEAVESAKLSSQNDLLNQQLDSKAQVDNMETGQDDEERGIEYSESQSSSTMPGSETAITLRTLAKGSEESPQYSEEAETKFKDTAMITSNLETLYEDEADGPDPPSSPDYMTMSNPEADTLLVAPEEGLEVLSQDSKQFETALQTESEDTMDMKVNPKDDFATVLSNIRAVQSTPEVSTDEPEVHESIPSKADAVFLDEIIRKSEGQEKTSEVLGMVLTIRNKVNNGYVLRPTDLGKRDDWVVEYSLEEVTGRRAWSLYEACKLRRKKALEMTERTDEQAAADYYLQQMRRLSREGKKYRKKLNHEDRSRPVVVYKSPPSREEMLEKEYKGRPRPEVVFASSLSKEGTLEKKEWGDVH